MNKIWGLIAILVAAHASWVACNSRTAPGQPQTLILLMLVVGYLYKSAVPTLNSLLAALQNSVDIPHYIA